MERQKSWMFDKRTMRYKNANFVYEGNEYEHFRHRLVELYFNIKKWGIKFHVEFDAETMMEGTEFNFQLMLGPFHFLYSCENYIDRDGLMQKPEVFKARSRNVKSKFN